MGPNNESHPGLAPILLEKLLKAREMGFKLLSMTNFGTIRSPEIPKDMRVTIEGGDAYWDYADRLSDCSEFIKSMGCGSYLYNHIKQAQQPVSAKQSAEAVAEWVDGDALAAHCAFGADVFCTNDRARGAGSGSSIHPSNMARLKEKFGILVRSPDGLVSSIG